MKGRNTISLGGRRVKIAEKGGEECEGAGRKLGAVTAPWDLHRNEPSLPRLADNWRGVAFFWKSEKGLRLCLVSQRKQNSIYKCKSQKQTEEQERNPPEWLTPLHLTECPFEVCHLL